MRKLLPGFLKPEALQKYVGIMDSIAKKHLETSWDFKNEVMVFPLAKEYTFAVACRLFLSIEDPKHIAKFSHPFHFLAAGVISIPINLPGTPFNRAIKAAEMIRKELLEIIKQRKKEMMEKKLSPKHDILSHMLTTTDENVEFMKENDIADKIIEQVPVSNTKQRGELLNWEDLQKMKYSWNVASEVMRLAPPLLQGNFREAITDFTYAGFSIPKGWKVYVISYKND
ncbi:hypothetical protein F0562_030881 [Nyssa sinensis]|uniref:Uncharacterized protein n=1 Tax=Nyssa sinensis TaxID=561372 RepID=A0A5J5B015_9ASTE|nr:hypothetical protein F0562_030881 [Nyssa sinensis]